MLSMNMSDDGTDDLSKSYVTSLYGEDDVDLSAFSVVASTRCTTVEVVSFRCSHHVIVSNMRASFV